MTKSDSETNFDLMYDARVLCVHVCVSRPLGVAGPLLEALVAECRGPELHANLCFAERFSPQEAMTQGREVKRIAEAATGDEYVFVFHVFVNTDEDREHVALRARAVAEVSPREISVVVEEYVGDAGRHGWSMIQNLIDPSAHFSTDASSIIDTIEPVAIEPSLGGDRDLKILRILTCGTHGNRKWQGHIMCSNCGRVFQTSRHDKPRFAPFACKCGAQLMPDEEDRIGDAMGLFNQDGSTALSTAGGVSVQLQPYEKGNFSSRAICDHCFRKIDKRFAGKVPNYEEAMKRRQAEAKVVEN